MADLLFPPVRVKARAGAVDVPLIAHLIHRLGVGGMENGLVNLINRMPADRYRHAIICLTEYTDFRERFRRADVECYALHKRGGKDLGLYPRLWRLLHRLRPAIVHTRNLPTFDSQVTAALAGVRRRIHGEHGRDVTDQYGTSGKYNRLRRVLRRFPQRYIAVSRDLEVWLRECIGVPTDRIVQIYNGVDTQRFGPSPGGPKPLPVAGFARPEHFIIGTIGRMETVKDQLNLALAFVCLLQQVPALHKRARLVLVGDGPLRTQVERLLLEAGVRELAWLPGTRADVPQLLRTLDVFVLPSLAEGISNTILEAMASGLPVVATNVGGNPELVVEGETGMLVPPADPEALAQALRRYVDAPVLGRAHGLAGRARVERMFSLEAMVRGYMGVYDALLAPAPARTARVG